VYELALVGRDKFVEYSMAAPDRPTPDMGPFAEGQRVRVQWVERGIPPWWREVGILDMELVKKG